VGTSQGRAEDLAAGETDTLQGSLPCILARGSLLFAKNKRGFRATHLHQDLISLPA
jgi:hypothetical protein